MNKYELQARKLILAEEPIPPWIIAHVKELDLSDTDVEDLTPLRGLTALERLYLEGTGIADLSPLSDIPTLERLNLDHTLVVDITPLSALTALQELGLNNTQVADIAPLAGLINLQDLFLSNTLVTDFSPVAHVKFVYKDWEKYMNDQTENYMQVREIKSCTYRDWDGELLFESQVKAVVHDDNLGDIDLEFTINGGLKEAEAELRQLFPNYHLHSAVKPETKNTEQ